MRRNKSLELYSARCEVGIDELTVDWCLTTQLPGSGVSFLSFGAGCRKCWDWGCSEVHLLEHLGCTSEPITRFADGDVEDDFLDSKLPHGVRCLVLL